VRDKTVFISYKISDGGPWAEHLERGLSARGYNVRRDGGEALEVLPGDEVQRSILQEIQRCGIFLLVDTMEATDSRWIVAEVDAALSSRTPILSVVIEGDHTGADPRYVPVPSLGGRFLAGRELRTEYRLTIDQQKAAQARVGTRFGALDDEAFLKLETMIKALVQDQKQLRLKLIDATKFRLQQLGFSWSVVDEDRVLYRAELPLDSDYSPGLRLCLLVQCLPHDEDLGRMIAGLDLRLKGAMERYQYGILVITSGGYREEKRQLLGDSGRRILLLSPDELTQLPLALQHRLPPGGNDS
jgi:hypothetical protein